MFELSNGLKINGQVGSEVKTEMTTKPPGHKEKKNQLQCIKKRFFRGKNLPEGLKALSVGQVGQY
jgi:hypothetical protein